METLRDVGGGLEVGDLTCAERGSGRAAARGVFLDGPEAVAIDVFERALADAQGDLLRVPHFQRGRETAGG